MLTVTPSADLTGRNTFRLPMTARSLVDYDVSTDLDLLWRRGIFRQPWFHIGSGSNLLFASRYYDGVILHSAIRVMEIYPDSDDHDTVFVKLGAGLVLDEVIGELVGGGLYGLENLSGIPGEVGAGAVQNVGAYGVEFGDRIISVEVFDTVTGDHIIIPHDECRYGYRESRFKTGSDAGRYIVTYVTVRMTRNPETVLTYGPLSELPSDTSPADIRRHVMAVRAGKLPDIAEYGSAGSYFKNPVVTGQILNAVTLSYGAPVPAHEAGYGLYKISAAWLIDHAGLKGSRCGGAALWPLQPLVIYNMGDATAADVIALEHEITGRVKERFGICLEPEVQRVQSQ